MADSGVYDTWHKSHPADGEPRCPEHKGLVSTARHGKGRRWQARWRDDQDKQRKRAFKLKSAAEAHLAKVKSDLARGVYVDQAAGRETVEECGERWRVEQLHRDSTGDRVERALRLHIYPVLGHLRMSQVRSSNIQKWVTDRSAVLSPSTLRVVYSGILVPMFSRALADRIIGMSPCVGIRLPDIEYAEHFIPTTAQVHALADGLAERYRALVFVTAGLGLRIGEALGLEVEHVDFLRREVYVRQQLRDREQRKGDAEQGIQERARRIYLGQLKTKTSYRTVELAEVVSVALARHLEQFPACPVEVEDATNPRKARRRPARLVFTDSHGKPLDRRVWSRAWTPVARKVGLPPRTGLHALRHFYATSLIHAGSNVKSVQLALGHATPTITLNTYTHEWPDAVSQTRAIIDAALDVPSECPETGTSS